MGFKSIAIFLKHNYPFIHYLAATTLNHAHIPAFIYLHHHYSHYQA